MLTVSSSLLLLKLHCGCGIKLEVRGVTSQIISDFIRYRSIDRTGLIIVPKDKDKLDLAMWFSNRGCKVKFLFEDNDSIGLFCKFLLRMKVCFLNLKLLNL